MDYSIDKTKQEQRILEIYQDLLDNKEVDIDVKSEKFGVDKKTIKRDLTAVEEFLDTRYQLEIQKSKPNIYKLSRENAGRLTQTEVLAVCNILLNSRAFSKKEMKRLLDKIIEHNLDKEESKYVTALTGNEMHHYAELSTSKQITREDILDNMKNITEAVASQKKIEIEYKRNADVENIIRKLCPLAIMFSEMYFYMAAKIEDKEIEEKLRQNSCSSPAIYRLDRISSVKILDEHFTISEKDRFKTGEFKSKSKFMYGGNIRHITFDYTGTNKGMILDQIPTAKEMYTEGNTTRFRAAIIGDGPEMWLRLLKDAVKIIPPAGKEA